MKSSRCILKHIVSDVFLPAYVIIYGEIYFDEIIR